jgi:hypothetical protein
MLMKTKTLTLNEEQFNIVFRALKDYYHNHPSENFAKEIDQVIKLVDTIPYEQK